MAKIIRRLAFDRQIRIFSSLFGMLFRTKHKNTQLFCQGLS